LSWPSENPTAPSASTNAIMSPFCNAFAVIIGIL
jgi:hypothetical protein